MMDLTKITTPVGLLDEEMFKRLKAHRGAKQRWHSNGHWYDLQSHEVWHLDRVIRAKPEPPKPREFWVNVNFGAWNHKSSIPEDIMVIRTIEWPEGAPLPDMPREVIDE